MWNCTTYITQLARVVDFVNVSFSIAISRSVFRVILYVNCHVHNGLIKLVYKLYITVYD
jgi:hypothetical protein